MLCIRWAANAARPVATDVLLAFHWHPSGLEPIRNIQYGFLGVGSGGGFSGTNPLWVCDAACVNTAGAKSMRKRSAGHAMPFQRTPSRKFLRVIVPGSGHGAE